jgi:hypothetical protein
MPQSELPLTEDELRAFEEELQTLRHQRSDNMEERAAQSDLDGALGIYIPRVLQAARQTAQMRSHLVEALAWLQAWDEGADLSEIEIFALRRERLLEFTRRAQALLDGHQPPSALDEAAALS